MRALIYASPILTAGLAASLYGWTALDIGTIVGHCMAFFFAYLLVLQVITLLFLGRLARAMYFQAGFAPVALGMLTLFGLLLGKALNAPLTALYQTTAPTSAAFQLTNALYGVVGIAMLLWPVATIVWAIAVPHCDEAEAEMLAKERAWLSRPARAPE
jgi:hypothetical protein